MKHYGEYEREAAILLGYNASQGRVLVLQLKETTEQEQTWLANYLASHQNAVSLASVMMADNYNNQNAFGVFGGRAVQIPLHFVKIADRNQAEQWTGSSSQYNSKVVDHPFCAKLRQALGVYAPGAVSETVFQGGNYIPPVETSGQFAPPVWNAGPSTADAATPIPQTSYTLPAGYQTPAPVADVSNDILNLKMSVAALASQLSSIQTALLNPPQPAPERKKPGRKPKVVNA